jgi:molybdate transport system substrate-binding protein
MKPRTFITKKSAILVLLFSLAVSLRAAEINVYAASSLTDAMKEIGAGYEKQSGDHLVFNFAASSTLARQIEEGAPADIFFSADDAQMDRVQKSGYLENESRRDLLSNTLVIIAPADSPIALGSAVELARNAQRIALGDPKLVPVGVYTRAYLEKLNLWKKIEPKIIPTENVRAALAVVESGNVDAAFVYKTDANVSRKVKITFSVPPAETSIHYPAALVKQAPRKPEAEKLLRYLGSDDASKIFEKFGFIVKR